MIVDKKQNTAGVIDAAIPDDSNIRKKEKNKSVPEAEETTKVHGTTLVTSKMVPVVTGGNSWKGNSWKGGCNRFQTHKKNIVLGTARVLHRPPRGSELQDRYQLHIYTYIYILSLYTLYTDNSSFDFRKKKNLSYPISLPAANII